MSIVSANSLEAKGFRAVLSNKLTFYKGDRLNLSFIIANKLISEVDSKEVVDGILPIDSENVEAFMILEDGSVKGTIKQDNKVVFMLEPEYQKIGENYFQIVIKENLADGSIEILHTPPFKIDIEPPLGYVEGDEARVGYALVGKSRVAAPVVYADVDIGYVEWVTGDLITADRLNAMEASIYEHTQMLDKLLYKPITASISVNPNSAEIGSVVDVVTIKWSLSKTPVWQTLDGVEIENNVRNAVFERISSNRTWRVQANDGKQTASANGSISFMNAKYYGSRTEGVYDSTFILSLSNKVLTTTKNGNITVNCLDGQYVFFAIPSRFGTPTFVVGGFAGGFIKMDTVEFTNASGYSENYDIWKSENPSLGQITITIS